jgi:pimeloyl-ACP methyl ester carboxylesterase
VAALLAGGAVPPDWGAAAVVHPFRSPLTARPDLPFETVRFESAGAPLEGWLFQPGAAGPGVVVVYLHGISDNRQSGLGVAHRLLPRGYAVLAFDARAHGRSGGEACSYGYHERHDVSRALDALGGPRAVLLGHSLGAAVALQAAAVDPRIEAVVAVSTFSDLRSIVEERARWFLLPPRYVTSALARAGELGRFPPEEASPVLSAARVRVPVLLLHGAADAKTPPHHSQRVAAALGGPKRLVLLPGVGHDEILGRPEAWSEIDAFLDASLAHAQDVVLPTPLAPAGSPRRFLLHEPPAGQPRTAQR